MVRVGALQLAARGLRVQLREHAVGTPGRRGGDNAGVVAELGGSREEGTHDSIGGHVRPLAVGEVRQLIEQQAEHGPAAPAPRRAREGGEARAVVKCDLVLGHVLDERGQQRAALDHGEGGLRRAGVPGAGGGDPDRVAPLPRSQLLQQLGPEQAAPHAHRAALAVLRPRRPTAQACGAGRARRPPGGGAGRGSAGRLGASGRRRRNIRRRASSWTR